MPGTWDTAVKNTEQIPDLTCSARDRQTINNRSEKLKRARERGAVLLGEVLNIKWLVRADLSEKMRVEGTASAKDLGWKIPGPVQNQQGMVGVEGQIELLGEEEREVTG